MVVIVRAFPVSVEDLAQLSRLPSVDELRPGCCPLCEQPSRELGGGLQVVGHGTYRRQALGLTGGCREMLIWIRRFLCRACGRTISVLPDSLYPGRWYSAALILASLTLALLGGGRHGRSRSGSPVADPETGSARALAAAAPGTAVGLVFRTARIRDAGLRPRRQGPPTAAPALVARRERQEPTGEARSHWVRDVTFDEDRSRIRVGAGPQVMATLRNLAISVHRLNHATNIAAATRACARDHRHTLALIACRPLRQRRSAA